MKLRQTLHLGNCPRVSHNRDFSHSRLTNTGRFSSPGLVGRSGTESDLESPDDACSNFKGRQVPESVVCDTASMLFHRRPSFIKMRKKCLRGPHKNHVG